MHTIGQIIRKFTISRSTLLYYDFIGLHSASGRNDANYRLYSDAGVQRMERISHCHETGMSLESIVTVLDKDEGKIIVTHENRLFKINEEIQKLRTQQVAVIGAVLPNLTFCIHSAVDRVMSISRKC